MKALKYISLTFLSLSLFVFMSIYHNIKLIGEESFDLIKWLDADLFILERVFLPLFISAIVLLFIDVTYTNYQARKKKTKLD